MGAATESSVDLSTIDSSTDRERSTARIERWAAWAIGIIALAVCWWVNRGHMAASPDSVTYISSADALRAGDGLGSWLENPLSTFPPAWPLAIAGVPFVGTETSAFLWIGVALVAIPHLCLSVLRQVTSSPPARLAGMVAVALSPALLPWSYSGLSEVPFAAVALGCTALALASMKDRRWLWAAAGVAALAPLIRYAGVAVPVALAVWVAFDRRRARRWITAAAVLVIGTVPLAVTLVVNTILSGDPMGGRVPSVLSPVDVVAQSLATIGRTALWTLDRAPKLPSIALGVVVIAVIAVAVVGPRTSDPGRGRRGRALLALMAGVGWLVLVAGRARVEMDDLDGRLLSTTAVFVLLLAVCLVGDADRSRIPLLRWTAVAGVGLWCVIGLGAVARGVHDQTGGYQGTAFAEARALPELGQVPERCRRITVNDLDHGRFPACGILADEPWAWYPSDVRPLMTPRREQGGSSSDVERLRRAVADGSTIYVAWTTVNEPYGALVPLQQLKDEFRMTRLGEARGIELYRIDGNA